MAVTSVNRIGTVSGSERSMQLTEVYQAITDSPSTDVNAVLADAGCPQPGQPHPEVSWLFVRDRRPQRQLESRLLWNIEIEYAQFQVTDDILDKVLESSNPYEFEYPEFRPPTKQWRTSEVLRPERFHRCTTRDGQIRQGGSSILSISSGNLITNTAGITPDVPPQRRAFNRVFTLTRFEANWDDSKADPYLGFVNSAPFKGKAAYTVLCTMMDAENRYVRTGGILRELALVTYQFEYDRDGQWEDIPNVSTVEFDGADYVQLLDSAGTPISTPVFLDELGLKIDPANLPADETFIRTFSYEEVDFNDLEL